MLKSKKLVYILLGVTALLLVLAACLHFDQMAIALYGKDNPKAKGELLTTYLSVIGGCAVIYGLYLNNKRIGEQTRQNDIATCSNNDKRFGEAIGYLNSENIGIATGAVHILNQLAKEDIRYTPIVANVYLDILSEPSALNLSNGKTKLIFESLFSDSFNSQRVIFRKLNIRNASFDTINNKVFENCILEKTSIHNISNSAFIDCSFDSIHLMNIETLQLVNSKINKCIFSNNGNELNELYIYECNIIASKIVSARSLNTLSIQNCQLKTFLYIASPKIFNISINIDISMEKAITIATDKLTGINLHKNISIIPYKNYYTIKNTDASQRDKL